MRTRTIGWTLALCFVAVAVCFAGTHMGTWKLNEAKSKLTAGTTRNHTVIYEAAGDKTKITVEGTDGAGKATHSEWTGKFDGTDYPVTGDANSDARTYKEVDAQTLEFSLKKDGKITATGRIVLSADGKSRTVTLSGTDAKGTKFSNSSVYDKQ